MTAEEEICLVGTEDFKLSVVERLLKLKGSELREAMWFVMREEWGVSAEGGFDIMTSPKVSILLDFYSFIVHFSRQNTFTEEKASCFLSIAKRVHDASVEQMLTVENSLKLLKDLLLKHSVHRPPYSVGVFTLKELQLLTDYMTQTYYKHYDLYQFASVKEFCMTVTQTHPTDGIQTPSLPVAPLSEAMTEEEHLAKLEQERLAREAEEAERRREKEEAEMKAREALKDVECTEEVSDVIAKTVAKHVGELEEEMRKQFQQREDELLRKIQELSSGKTN